MNIEDVTTIDELAEFMTAEAALWARGDVTEQKTVNGEGMRQQWKEREACPHPVFYLVYKSDAEEANPDGRRRVIFNLEVMWFDDDGNLTDKPEDE